MTQHNIGDRVSYYRNPKGSTVFTGTIKAVYAESLQVTPDHDTARTHTVLLEDISEHRVHLWTLVETSVD
jgi:hypothetical protein